MPGSDGKSNGYQVVIRWKRAMGIAPPGPTQVGPTPSRGDCFRSAPAIALSMGWQAGSSPLEGVGRLQPPGGCDRCHCPGDSHR